MSNESARVIKTGYDIASGYNMGTRTPDAADAEYLAMAVDLLRSALRFYETQIAWETTCVNCAVLLSQSYDDVSRAERAEAALAAALVRIGELEIDRTERP